MIVGSCFYGDDDMETARRQHDVYGEALGQIIAECNRLARFARDVVGDSVADGWGTTDRVDHRTLQWAHDLLAAAWRYHNPVRQTVLELPEFQNPQTLEVRWLDWLSKEVKSWMERPMLVREVQNVITNANTGVGYAAEARLSLALCERFEEVPWEPRLLKSFRVDAGELW